MASDPVGFLKRGAIKAAFGPVNSAAKSALNAVPIGFVRDIAQAVRQRIWDWATSEDDKLPTEAAGGTASGLVGFAAAHYGTWKQMFPWMTIGGWRARGSVPGSDHPKGKALDLMTASGTVAHQIISRFLGQTGAKYWIWNRQFASAATGWRPRGYSGPSPHTDHVHLSYYHNGGRIAEDITGVGHSTGRMYGFQSGENVIPRAGHRGRGGDTYNFHFPNYVGNRSELVSAINHELDRGARLGAHGKRGL
jgi:hypothetical protein